MLKLIRGWRTPDIGFLTAEGAEVSAEVAENYELILGTTRFLIKKSA